MKTTSAVLKLTLPLMLALSGSVLSAAEASSVPAAPATVASAGKTKVYNTQKLSNGLEVISLASHKVPLATLVLTCKAGAMTETPESNGLTHLWEHMFFKGNARIPNQEAFNKRIRQLGISFNGDTAEEKVRYYFTLPAMFVDEGLQFMADAIATPLLEQTELEKERHVVLDEYDRNASQPAFDFRRLSDRIVYGDKAYLRDALGVREVIAKATREQMLKIKNDVFVPANCALMVSGDIKEDAMIKSAEKHFAVWQTPKDWKPLQSPVFPNYPKSTSFVMTRPMVDNASIDWQFNGPKVGENPADTYAADVLSTLLQHKSGKFFRKFIDSGMTLDAAAYYYTQAKAGEIHLTSRTTVKNLMKVKKELLKEVQNWVKPDYFTQDQLDDVRRSLTINHKREMNAPSEFIKTLAFWWPVTGLGYYDGYIENMQKVSLADVAGYVKKYMVNQPYVESILISPENAKKLALKDSSVKLMEKYFPKEKGSPTKAATPKSASVQKHLNR